MPNVLTDAAIKRLEVPTSGTKTYWDATVRGLGVRVSPKGTKTFIALVGSGQRHKIGRYPIVSLSLARDEARKLLAKKTLGQYEKASTLTWDTALTRYLEACKRKNRARTVAEYDRLLARLPFKGRRVSSIKKREVALALEGITARSERAHILTAAKVFFSWLAAEGHIDASPISALKSPAERKNRARRALSQPELATLVQAALRYPYPFGQIVALLALTGQRRNEIASLKWEHITTTTITIPADIAKNRHEHTFPIGSLAAQVIASIPKQGDSPYLFPATRSHVRGKPTAIFNGWSKAKRAFDQSLSGVAPYALHDLRRTFTTTMQELGIAFEVRERLVNHVIPGVAGVYNVYGYGREMQDAIARYDAHLIQLLGSGET